MSAAQSIDQNTIGITVGKSALYGWESARVTRSIEHFPSTFELELTERYPTQPLQIVINPGDPVTVTFGSDTVISGYLDSYSASYDAHQHTVRIAGSSKCMDMVECSAGEAPYQLNNMTLVGLAKQLAAPYGITVSAPDGDSATIPQTNVTLTESAFELLEHIARWSNFIITDDTSGNLLISRVGSKTAASGFVEGQNGNVQSGNVTLTMQDRFTEILAVYLSTGFLIDGPPPHGSSGPVVPFPTAAQAKDTSFPPRADGQPRFRRLIVVSEQSQNSTTQAAARAQWDMASRVGRSQAVRLTCDSWRDSSRALWAPNTLAPINLPSLKLPNRTWLIATVSFVRDGRGTTAELVLMPKSALVPDPENLAPFDAQLAQELPGGTQRGCAPAPR